MYNFITKLLKKNFVYTNFQNLMIRIEQNRIELNKIRIEQSRTKVTHFIRSNCSALTYSLMSAIISK